LFKLSTDSGLNLNIIQYVVLAVSGSYYQSYIVLKQWLTFNKRWHRRQHQGHL